MDSIRIHSNERYVSRQLVCLILANIVVKFVLLHDQKNDDGIRQFFLDLWELYVKVSARSHLQHLIKLSV